MSANIPSNISVNVSMEMWDPWLSHYVRV